MNSKNSNYEKYPFLFKDMDEMSDVELQMHQDLEASLASQGLDWDSFFDNNLSMEAFLDPSS